MLLQVTCENAVLNMAGGGLHAGYTGRASLS